MTDESAEARLDSIRLDSSGAAELEDDRLVIFVPRAEISRLELARGTSVRYPVATVAMGVTLIPASALVLAVLIVGTQRAHSNSWRAVAFSGFAVTGLWQLDLSLRKRWLLVVHTPSGRRKLAFHTCRDRQAIEAFVRDCRQRFGYG